MKFKTPSGIVAFGSAIPSLAIQVTEIEQAQGQPKAGPPRAEIKPKHRDTYRKDLYDQNQN